MMSTSSLAVFFILENGRRMPNIQLLIHLVIIWAPDKIQPLVLSSADLTHQYSEELSVWKL